LKENHKKDKRSPQEKQKSIYFLVKMIKMKINIKKEILQAQIRG
jgi:hypothetical protein